jgi:hypothetical protein
VYLLLLLLLNPGVASTNAWLSLLSWEYARDFAREPGEVWSMDGLPAGWQRNASTLTQVVVRNAGHMVGGLAVCDLSGYELASMAAWRSD